MENESLKKMRDAVIITIRFYDIFSFALSLEDLWRYLPARCSMDELRDIVLPLVAEGRLCERSGYYYLCGREDIFNLKEERILAQKVKLKRAMLMVKIFRLIPWIRLIGIVNVMGEGNFRKNGDIDFFIVTKKDRIWLVRFFCVVITDLLRLRPKINDTKDKICLSFFMTDNKMNLEKLLLDSDKVSDVTLERDPGFIYWFANLIPLFNDGVYDELMEKNRWLFDVLPNWTKKQVHRDKQRSKFVVKLMEIILLRFERLIKNFQLHIMPSKIREAEKSGTNVVVSDDILKFHTNDRRRSYRERVKGDSIL